MTATLPRLPRRRGIVQRPIPHWTDLHMTAKMALLNAADRQGWDYQTVMDYIAALPKTSSS